jgi:hypothetical protein
MEIDRTNYEIWLIDWLEGNLSDLQVEQLKLFLNENPELREEFDELVSFSLKSSIESYPFKGRLKKTIADLSELQFEYLCVAYLENDLSAGQLTELMQLIDQNPEKKKTFELLQKIRLVPADISYKFKSQLIKRTPLQRVIRLSVIGLSAAAAIILIIMTYLNIPRNLSDKINNTAQNIAVDSSLQQPYRSDKIITVKKQEINDKKSEILFDGIQRNNSTSNQIESFASLPNDSLFRNNYNPEMELKKIPVYAEIDLRGNIISNTLVASKYTFIIPPFVDERSNLSKFIAKTFRQKILKENILQDSPLKGYEIAEAGIKGINRLLGWEMALNMNNDENGEVRSVYFSSKILKFNAPVNKTKPLP